LRTGSNTAKPTVSGNRLLTMCEAAQVLRLSARTVREYARRGESRGKALENGGHYDVQTLTPSSKTQAETGMDFRMLVLMRFISRLKIKLARCGK
jgi:hypothetical protein